MALGDDLLRIAPVAAEHGEVVGLLAAEPDLGRRLYLVAYGAGEVSGWLVLGADGDVVHRREDVRDTASVVALCELAADVAGGGDLPSLRARLDELAEHERPDGLDGAMGALLRLEQAVGDEPRLASPAYLDEVGFAARDLERSLGETASPFAEALRAGTAAIDEFVQDVERRYLVDLR